MSKNLNKKKEIKIRIIPSNKSKEIHMPTNSSITTKLGSSFSNSTFNEIKLINKIGINIKNLARKLILSPKKKISMQGNKLQKVPEPMLM